MISTASLSIQFGAKPLFENVSVTFGNGNRYGLIGANGSGKSTFMKILSGELVPSAGSVSTDAHVRIGKLRQNQFAYEEFTVLDTVIMGHEALWRVKQERERIYALPEMTEEEGLRVADLEVEFAELDGYTAESRAGELLLGVGIPLEQHSGLMTAVPPGLKLTDAASTDWSQTRTETPCSRSGRALVTSCPAAAIPRIEGCRIS